MTTPICDPNEDHEKYAGEVIADPWDDETQTDWPNCTIEEVINSGDTVGTDSGSATLPGLG